MEQMNAEQQWAVAVTVKCPECHARVNHKCFGLPIPIAEIDVDLTYPHRERLALAMEVAGMKVQRGYIFTTDGSIYKVRPFNGKKFDYRELQEAVGGTIESLVSGWKNCCQMFCNEEGLMRGLPPNPYTETVCNLKVYRLNGYGPAWRVSGDIIALKSEEPNPDVQLPTVHEVMTRGMSLGIEKDGYAHT